MPVADVIENYYAYRDMEGMSDEEAVNAVLDSFRTIPCPDALRAVLEYEAGHEPPLRLLDSMPLSAMTSGWSLIRTFRVFGSRSSY